MNAVKESLGTISLTVVVCGLSFTIAHALLFDRDQEPQRPYIDASELAASEPVLELAPAYWSCELAFTPDEHYRLIEQCRSNGGFPEFYGLGSMECTKGGKWSLP